MIEEHRGIKLGPINVLIGNNGTGKSQFFRELDVIYLGQQPEGEKHSALYNGSEIHFLIKTYCDLANAGHPNISKIKEKMVRLFPDAKNIIDALPTLFSDYSEESINSVEFMVGFRTMLGYLTLLYCGDQAFEIIPEESRIKQCGPIDASLFLVESPEYGLHFTIYRFLVGMLRAMSAGIEDRKPVQVFLTTYSPYLLDLFEPEEVLLFQRADGKESITRLSDTEVCEKFSEKSGHLLGEIWGNGLFDDRANRVREEVDD